MLYLQLKPIYLLSVLCVGTGYLTACFAMMVGPQGRVVGIEHIPELVSSSIENIKRSAAASSIKDGFLTVHVAGVLDRLFQLFYQTYFDVHIQNEFS